MSRLPIRVRLTLAFALAMAIVLAATGAFLYLRLGSSLDETIDEGLQARAAELAPVAADNPSVLAGGSARDETFATVLSADDPLVTPDQRKRAADGPLLVERDEVAGVEGPVRLLLTPLPDGRILAVGASLEERNEALAGFLGELLIIGPVALLLASLLGFGIGTAALRPVEAMRAEANAISASEPGRRLPVPAARDEVARLADTLNEMLGRLEGAIERERTFVADASHELRTPLALLKAELELALRRPRTQAELEEALRSAATETDRLARLAEDLLVLARSDRGKLPLRREPVPVRDLLARVAGRYGAGRAVEVDAPKGLRVDADASRIEQALGNVVDNAFRHGAGHVRLVAAARDGFVDMHVTDEGEGFPAEFLPRAFERFSRADSARTGGGAGLGLAIAEMIARAHGGHARAVNREGKGADVWISLPAP